MAALLAAVTEYVLRMDARLYSKELSVMGEIRSESDVICPYCFQNCDNIKNLGDYDPKKITCPNLQCGEHFVAEMRITKMFITKKPFGPYLYI